MFSLISSRSGSQSAMLLRWALQGHHGPLVTIYSSFHILFMWQCTSSCKNQLWDGEGRKGGEIKKEWIVHVMVLSKMLCTLSEKKGITRKLLSYIYGAYETITGFINGAKLCISILFKYIYYLSHKVRKYTFMCAPSEDSDQLVQSDQNLHWALFC